MYKQSPREDSGPAGFGQVKVDRSFASKIVSKDINPLNSIKSSSDYLLLHI